MFILNLKCIFTAVKIVFELSSNDMSKHIHINVKKIMIPIGCLIYQKCAICFFFPLILKIIKIQCSI